MTFARLVVVCFDSSPIQFYRESARLAKSDPSNPGNAEGYPGLIGSILHELRAFAVKMDRMESLKPDWITPDR